MSKFWIINLQWLHLLELMDLHSRYRIKDPPKTAPSAHLYQGVNLPHCVYDVRHSFSITGLSKVELKHKNYAWQIPDAKHFESKTVSSTTAIYHWERTE